MKSDISRDTFDPANQFSRVIMQQGRVQLDADWNEQADILLHYLRALAADLIGPHGGPGDGFKIEGIEIKDSPSGQKKQDFTIQNGRYYVEGILCENEALVAYSMLKGISFKDFNPLGEGKYLVYLDVWERHISCFEDETIDEPSLREVALGGADTASRAKVIWQVIVKPSNIASEDGKDYAKFSEEIAATIQPGTGRLKARAKFDQSGETDPCLISPEARYRGENQLYRVEVHAPSPVNGGPTGATFKWSRDNGSVIFPIRQFAIGADGQATATLNGLGLDNRLSLTEGDWVEVVDDDYALQNANKPLLQVFSLDRTDLIVVLNGGDSASRIGMEPNKHPFLRRWDQKEGDPNYSGLSLSAGAAKIVERSQPEENWLTLEDGVQIQFQAPAGPDPNQYRTGDYWLIPARVATGDVLWPKDGQGAKALGPRGVAHSYAPLAFIETDADGMITASTDLRRTFIKLTMP